MTIDIQPEVGTAIQQRMATGAFGTVDELLMRALAALPIADEFHAKTGGQALIDAFEPIRGLLTDEEVNILFARDQSPTRLIDLS